MALAPRVGVPWPVRRGSAFLGGNRRAEVHRAEGTCAFEELKTVSQAWRRETVRNSCCKAWLGISKAPVMVVIESGLGLRKRGLYFKP